MTIALLNGAQLARDSLKLGGSLELFTCNRIYVKKRRNPVFSPRTCSKRNIDTRHARFSTIFSSSFFFFSFRERFQSIRRTLRVPSYEVRTTKRKIIRGYKQTSLVVCAIVCIVAFCRADGQSRELGVFCIEQCLVKRPGRKA